MKKIFLFLLFVPCLMQAQMHFSTVKLGVFDPSATSAGFILGYEGGWYVDDNFLFGYSIDWFNKNYVDENLVTDFNSTFGINSQLNELRATTNLNSFPLMGTVSGNWPIGPRTRAFITGSLGLEILFISYRNYDNPNNSDSKVASDLCWNLGGGVMYELGKRTDGIIELTYHNSNPGWQYTVNDRIFERSYNMSGLMLRLGFRFYF
jgi:hypothetical protein